MSHPDTPLPQPSPPQPQAVTTKPRTGYGLLVTAILFAGIGGGLLAWHPWDKDRVPEPPKDPRHITIQRVGEQREAGESDSTRPVYCLTNETGGLYCMVMPGRYTTIQEERR
ncbi:hypothetical protein [Amycolatopsis alkalitolerans]|uniref:Uncharacterized protein n=1 Tax=Amycolatopsis alkalitolerans TaxID=2547244 RepID=A0A5C4LWG8_9PSEU|nr:hypothetical protein [Amycolatopsis alkalitolerans]TNC20983.1 hypothetical protein FG385_29485 [Amycolatopsis alkalitolerans]